MKGRGLRPSCGVRVLESRLGVLTTNPLTKRRTESPWESWRLLTLETRMESCQERRHRGSRRRVGTRMQEKDQAVRLVRQLREELGDRPWDGAAGRSPARLRRGVRAKLGTPGRHRRRCDCGNDDGGGGARIKALEREVKELRRANEILKSGGCRMNARGLGRCGRSCGSRGSGRVISWAWSALARA